MLVAALSFAAGCGDDDSDSEAGDTTSSSTTVASTPTTSTTTTTSLPPPTAAPDPVVALETTGLPELESGNYELWLVLDNELMSVGTFGSPEDFSTTIGRELAGEAAAAVVTIEVDDDPAPSSTAVLAGDLTDGVGDLTVDHLRALGVDFSQASGQYILATPTDGRQSGANERSGIWWTLTPRAQSLFLPELTAGWVYEGWQLIDGVPVTTGTFTDPFGQPDDEAPYSGPEEGPPLVGEDFLVNAPEGLTFPTDLRDTGVFISVEPSPDTGPGPFPITPLRGTVPSDAVDHAEYAVETLVDTLPTGSVTIDLP